MNSSCIVYIWIMYNQNRHKYTQQDVPYNERVSNYANVQLYIHLSFLQIFIYMYSWLKHLKSCFHVPCLHAYTLLLNWMINTYDDAENESDNKAQWYLRLRREGRNQLMVRSQEQMPFMFLVMLHPLPQMKDLKQHMMRKTEVTIQHDKNEWIWWRRAE
jgi:hypothetical protein